MPAETRDLSTIPGLDTVSRPDPDSGVALDELLKKQDEPADEPADPPAPEDKPADPPAPEDKPADKPADKATAPADKPADPATPAAPEPDDLDKVELPPYTKPKSVEAFDTVKRLARERITAAETERDALKKQVEELSAKVTNGLPAEVEQELKELRDFRSKLDVEASPEFKTFDAQVNENVEAIYSRMLAAGFTKEHVEQVKKEGGPAAIDWDAVANKLPLSLRRFIDTKLVENESLADKKAKALEAAKTNAAEYLRSREAEHVQAKESATKQAEQAVADLVPKLGWLEPRVAKADATAEQKAAVAAHNALVKDSQEFLDKAKSDDSPTMRGILAVGYVQLLKTRADAEEMKKSYDSQVTSLKAELKEAKDLLARVKKSSTTRLRESPAGSSDAKPATVDLNTTAADALDAHRRTLEAAAQ